MNVFDIFDSAITAHNNPVVFELGACDGTNTLQMVEKLEATGRPYRYFAFEPVAELVSCIRDRMGPLLSKITLIKAAVGAIDGKSAFYKSDRKYFGSSSLHLPTPALHRAWPEIRFENRTVDVISIDSFCERNGVDHIDFIWSDIQGAEGDMILGAKRMLTKTDWLYTECDGGLYEGDISETEMLAMLPDFRSLGRDQDGNLILHNEISA